MSRRLGKAVFSHGIPVVLLVWIFHDLNLRDAIVSLKRCAGNGTQLSLAQIRVNTQPWRDAEFENTTVG